MMKPAWILTMLSCAALSAGASDVTSKAPESSRQLVFLNFLSTCDSIKNAVKVSANTTIKFEGDSIILSDGRESRSISRQGVSRLSHSTEVKSDFQINVCGLVEGHPSIEGSKVVLSRKDKDNNVRYKAFTDSAGIATFKDLPYADYRMVVFPGDDSFQSIDNDTVYHTFNDRVSIALEENVFTPYDITVEHSPLHTGLTELDVSWNIRSDLDEAPFRGYRFFLEVDGNYYDETEDLHLHLAGLPPGSYTLELFALSGFGTLTERIPIAITIEEVDPDMFAGISDVNRDTESLWRYFDLNGREINAPNLSPGIYIRTDGLKCEKILIK